MNPVTLAIKSAVESSKAGKGRTAALKAVRWVMRSGSLYVGPVDPATLESPLVSDVSEALVFDGRDNELAKSAFFASLFGAPFTPELL